MELTGKTALVTGSARRVGRVIAIRLARAGASVIVHYNRSRADAETTAERIRALGVEAMAVRADLSEPERIEAMFSAVKDRFGRLDVLVNNAAVFGRTPIDELTAETFDAQMSINARAAALCIRYASQLMPDGGAIVNITDIAAGKAWAGYPAYCASKAALAALTKSAAMALAQRNIRVNAVAPGAILWREGATEAEKAAVLSHIPLKRIGSPEDIAAAAVFLIQQDYVTGQNLRVDGGWHMG